jgi:hypothetical protein
VQLSFPFPVEAPKLGFAQRNALRHDIAAAISRTDFPTAICALDRLRGRTPVAYAIAA